MKNKTLEERFKALEQDYQTLIATKYIDQNVLTHRNETYVDSGKYKNWLARVKKLLEDSYGKESDYYVDFNNSGNVGWSSNYNRLVNSFKPLFDAARDDLSHSATLTGTPEGNSALSLVLNILNRFPAFARELKRRYDNRTPLEINDEYDLQDMLYSILTLHFDDIRKEEYTPSFGGGASRQDFLLKKEKIVIEVKKTRKSLGAAKVGGELLIDMAHYRAHQDCDTLILFVYDPDHYVANPKGVIDDLESKEAEGRVKVVIAQA
ncbi:TPA_asm: malate dehydrogenase [Salmonella enterica]|nr:malate dehydrogenase [Salmonella enterica]EAO7615468.1 malate dehydrogenase [Salmonella enterica]EAQ6816075.1 malate dehydrogenase [Salmonella enterica]EBQ2127815.1 malate dehydrogenase [Salmonella enterica]EBT1277196.1 malate dehydrogenase [Salmonella enterica]